MYLSLLKYKLACPRCPKDSKTLCVVFGGDLVSTGWQCHSDLNGNSAFDRKNLCVIAGGDLVSTGLVRGCWRVEDVWILVKNLGKTIYLAKIITPWLPNLGSARCT